MAKLVKLFIYSSTIAPFLINYAIFMVLTANFSVPLQA